MTDPRHAGPECPKCLMPEATAVAWDDIPEGDGEGLCWGSGITCEDRRGETIAQLRADLASETATREALRVQEARVEGMLADAGVVVDPIRGVAELIRERDAMRAVVEAADDFAGVCDADIHPAALPLKRRLLAALAALAALDGAK